MIKQRDPFGWVWRSDDEIPEPNRSLRVKAISPNKGKKKGELIIEHFRQLEEKKTYSEFVASMKKKGYTDIWWCYLDEDLL